MFKSTFLNMESNYIRCMHTSQFLAIFDYKYVSYNVDIKVINV